ncbi:MAG: hypothetical protein A2161_04365 [Candidatus Schekmanbacteria bacterium RBG_13_48_7]|uniref:Flagellar hook protein FlgE n=1 Tax=Candidatus Schekmanbacteria bacterium RBG_13_48_7 TaxID=1817878 RepID=A0A1F7RSR9_9BACT|nr:MAG: hypothetical protein A2161_04365 [Candidatus Schekmanbacteria bacterium RBG_13_48_7]
MLNSFYSGLTGLNSYSSSMSIIGNNLANINTIGYKTNTANFQDLLSQMRSTDGTGNPMQVGLGVSIGSIEANFSQGSLQSTSEATNAAIQGAGFFILTNETGQDRYYSRAGNFTFDAQGYLVHPNGGYVAGWTQRDANNEIDTSTAIGRIKIPMGSTIEPKASNLVSIISNLDANAAVDDLYSTSITVHDSLGAAHIVTFNFKNTGPGAWDYDITASGDESTGGTPGTPFSLTTGSLSFDADGKLTAPAANPVFTTPTWVNGANTQEITWSLYSDDGSANLTGYASASTTSFASQNGFTSGTLSSVIIGPDGTIQGLFNNGETLSMAKLAIANFNNPKGLIKSGSNNYIRGNAGEPAIGEAESGGRGGITGGALEMSNVDLAAEFTSMIVSERGYQANSRIITTSDEMMQEVLQLKR